MITCNLRDWYWIVGGNGPHREHADAPFTGDESRRYSSAKLRYVPADDQDFLRWKDANAPMLGLPDPSTRIDTEANLAIVLEANGLKPNFG